MNDTESLKRGHVIPKWLDLQSQAARREIEVPRGRPFEINQATKEGISREMLEFKESPSLESACYLLGASSLIGDAQLARDMAHFIKTRQDAGQPIVELAGQVLEEIVIDFSLLQINTQIASLKEWVSRFPKSAVAWMELGRLYTIMGQRHKAKRAVLVALSLAPYDRYIVRCGVRFFLHIMDLDMAWHYISKANRRYDDPWLKATEINVAMIAEMQTPAFKRLLPKDAKGIDVFHFSELYESWGLLELNDGNNQKAKKQFKTAWTNPPESVVTHAEWVIRNKLPALRENSTLEYAKSLEALTWVQYYNLNLTMALDAARQWQSEESYSRSPFVVGASIACSADIPDEGVEMANQGLKANPGDSKLLNNYCYSLLRAGRIPEAEDALKRWRMAESEGEEVFILATEGLLEFKKGNLGAGRTLYHKAMSLSKKNQDNYRFAKAYLNLALAEVEESTPDAIKVVAEAFKVSDGIIYPDIVFLRKQILGRIQIEKRQQEK